MCFPQEDSTEDGPRKRMLESQDLSCQLSVLSPVRQACKCICLVSFRHLQDVVHVTVFAEGTDGLNELSFTVRARHVRCG